MDAITGKVITTLPIGEGCDGAVFDPVLRRAYSSNGEGTLTVVQEINAGNFKVLENFPTQPSARTLCLDAVSHHIYLPAAEFGEAVAGDRRPPVKPGSFVVLDVATTQ